MQQPTALARKLGTFDATLIVIGGIIGSGIFMNPAVVAQRAHTTPLIMAVWIFGGIVALIGGFIFAELARRRPDVGGMYGYLRDAFHPMLAFMSGWTALLVSMSGAIAATAVTFALYTAPYFHVSPVLIGVVVIAIMSIINCFGVREGVGAQNVLTVVKVLAVGGIIFAGLFVPHASV